MRFIPFLLAVCFTSCSTVPELSKNTPPTLAGYQKAVEDRLGEIWLRGVSADPDITLGTVKFIFKIPATGGSVVDLQLVSNTAGVVDARIARVALHALRLPPIPSAIPEGEHATYLSMDESFTVFEDRPQPSPRKR